MVSVTVLLDPNQLLSEAVQILMSLCIGCQIITSTVIIMILGSTYARRQIVFPIVSIIVFFTSISWMSDFFLIESGMIGVIWVLCTVIVNTITTMWFGIGLSDRIWSQGITRFSAVSGIILLVTVLFTYVPLHQ